MANPGVLRIPCPLKGSDGCCGGPGGQGMAKSYFISHLRTHHFNTDNLKAAHRSRIASDFILFSAFDLALHQASVWLCGECLRTHSFNKNCKHADGTMISAPDVTEAALCRIPTPIISHKGVVGLDSISFDVDLLDKFLSSKKRTVKCIPSKLRLGFSRIFLSALDKFEHISSAILRWRDPGDRIGLMKDRLAFLTTSTRRLQKSRNFEEANLFQCKRKLADGHFTAAIKVLTSSDVTPDTPDTSAELESKHPFVPSPVLISSVIGVDALHVHKYLVLDRIRNFPKGTSCGSDGLRAQHLLDVLDWAASAVADDLLGSITGVVNLFLSGKCPTQLGEFIASAPLTPLVKPGGGIRPIVVGTVWRRLVSKAASSSVGNSMAFYLRDLQFGIGIPGGCEAVVHSVNRLLEARGMRWGCLCSWWISRMLSTLLTGVSFSRRLECGVLLSLLGLSSVILARPDSIMAIAQSCELSLQAWYLDDRTIVGNTLMVAKALDIIRADGPVRGLFLNIDKTELFWPVEDPRGRVDDIFPTNISRPLKGVKLLGSSASGDAGFYHDLSSQRVSKTITLMEAIHKLEDPQCELLLRNCAGVAKLYYALRTCPPPFFGEAQTQFDQDLRISLERIVTGSGPGFWDWQWRLATLPIKLGGLGILCVGDVIRYAFLASRLQTSALQTQILSSSGITLCGSSFQCALDDFSALCGVNALSDATSSPAPKLMKSLAKIYFDIIETSLASHYVPSSRQISILSCIHAPHVQDFLFTIPIDGLGQKMNQRQFRAVLCYRFAIPLFTEGTLCPSYNVHRMDQWGDHAVHCSSDVGVKFRHNLVRDILVDICSKVSVPVFKEAPLGFLSDAGQELRPSDLLLFNWSQGKDACLDVTDISPFAGGGVSSWAPGVALLNAAEKKKKEVF
ncbi:hypothetical protein AgCh_008265 [Apium graveolens]